MNRERRTEVEHLVNETQNLIAEVDMKLNETGTPKYRDKRDWEKAFTAVSDKISDILTEEQGALDTADEESEKKEEARRALEESVAHLESALDACNAALDSVENEDYEQARSMLDDQVHDLQKAMG